MAIDNSYLVGLLGGSSSSNASANNLLSVLANSAASQNAAIPAPVSNPATTVRQPTPPWRPSSGAPQASDLVKGVLAGRSFINESAAKLDVPGASEDYRKLFALYQGLNALDGLANQAGGKEVTELQKHQLEKAFAAGLTEVGKYVDGLRLQKLEIASGKATSSEQTTVGAKVDGGIYSGKPLYQGAQGDVVPAFAGDVKFSMQVKKLNGVNFSIDFDLSEMNATPRTMQNVLDYLNGKLSTAGAVTRFGKKDLPAPPNTITVNGKLVTLPDAPDRWALTIKGNSTETVSLSSPETADAVYVTQSAVSTTTGVAKTPVSGTTTTTDGNAVTTTTGSSTTTVTTTQQLLKFQTPTSDTATPPPDATARPGDPLSVDGRAWSETLAKTVTAARATATAPDGSVYVLADVNGALGAQGIKGSSDVALFKYDPAGNLLFSRTLGAADQAQGFALAVSTDGKVAVAGSVTGGLTGATDPADPALGDSFVSVFNAEGEEQWTQRRAARQDDQASAVAFGADGSVYVAGKARSPMPGASAAIGGWDGYLEGFSSAGKASFTDQFGTLGTDAATSVAVDGSSVLVAGVEDGHAMVRRYDTTAGSAGTLQATRDLGDLQGGSIAGIAVDGGRLIVAGTARNPALGGAAAVNAASGGSDVFTASLDPALQTQVGESFAWYGGSGDDTATAMTVHDGKLYVAGRVNADLPGTTKIGSQDGFLAQIDPTTGTAAWTERFSGPGGKVAPTSIAVAGGGASVLDRLGLPSGTVTTSDSPLVTAATSLRVGDEFYVKADSTGSVKVTIEAGDTMRTLATKISRASGFRATVSVLSSNGMQTLQIKPSSSLSEVVLTQGANGKDALAPLGLVPGLIRNTPNPKDKSAKMSSGLNLSNALNLNSTDAIANAKSVLDQALSTVRVAYQNIVTGGAVKPLAPQGQAPQYLQNQIANYQAALQRLGGG